MSNPEWLAGSAITVPLNLTTEGQSGGYLTARCLLCHEKQVGSDNMVVDNKKAWCNWSHSCAPLSNRVHNNKVEEHDRYKVVLVHVTMRTSFHLASIYFPVCGPLTT